MPTTEFEEKEYEQPLYEELAFAPGATTPGQVLAHGGAPVPDPPPDPTSCSARRLVRGRPFPAPPGAVRARAHTPGGAWQGRLLLAATERKRLERLARYATRVVLALGAVKLLWTAAASGSRRGPIRGRAGRCW